MPSFRFLHASDFHLERPAAGLSEVADHLGEVLIDAPYRAAEKVFAAAIEQRVDFVLLAGDLVEPALSGPRGVLFLQDQFARLEECDIEVYWAGGRADRIHAWPGVIRWPANVHIFPADTPRCFTLTKEARRLCEIVGQSLGGEKPIDPAQFGSAAIGSAGAGFRIALAYGDFDHARLRKESIDYWALGGEHEPTLPHELRPLVHYPGSPQARSPGEPGPHGCTLVDVNERGEMQTTPIVTDVVRYVSEEVTVPEPLLTDASNPSRRLAAAELERTLRERMALLAEANREVALVIDFTLESQWLTPATAATLPLPAIVGVLRGEFGYRSPTLWLDRVRLPAPPPIAESWFEQETLLGDFLRAARQLGSAEKTINHDHYLPEGAWRQPMRDIARFQEPAIVQAALAEAASLGMGLLFPEEVR